jgi:hypothetical protein
VRDQHGESHFGKVEVKSVDGPRSRNVDIHLGHLFQRGCVAPNPRDRDFVTQRFGHGVQREFVKHKIATCLRVGPTITAHGHMVAEP